jgi:DivIVA domain-containing protein
MSFLFGKKQTKVTETLDATRLRAEAATLTHTKFREGYDIAAVDAFLVRAGVALDERRRGAPLSLTPDAVLTAKFASTKFREGYDQDEVDDLLDRVVVSLRTPSAG